MKNFFKKEKKKTPDLIVKSFNNTDPLFTEKITPSEIKSAIYDEDQAGKLMNINHLYTLLINSDDTVSGNIDTRLEALKSKEPALSDELPESQMEYFNNILSELYPTFCNMTIDLKMRGHLFRQIEFELRGNLYYPRQLISYHKTALDLRLAAGELVLYQDDKKTELNPLKFITAVNDKAILKTLLKYYVFYSFALNNWASFSEIYGKPPRVGKYSGGASKEEQNELWSMLQQAGNDLAFMHSENVELEFKDFANKAASVDIYSVLVNFCNKAKTKRILGQDLTTDSEKTGSYAQAKVHDLVRKDILYGDARDCNNLISMFLTRLNNINFNAEKIKTVIDVSEKRSLTEQLEIDDKLKNKIGIVFDPEYFYQKYGVPEPKGGMKFEEKPAFANLQGITNLQGLTNLEGLNNHFFQKAPTVINYLDLFAAVGDNAIRDQFAKLLQKVTGQATKLKKHLQDLKSYDDLQKEKFPTALYYEYGKAMTELILESYQKARVNRDSNLVPRVNRDSNLVPRVNRDSNLVPRVNRDSNLVPRVNRDSNLVPDNNTRQQNVDLHDDPRSNTMFSEQVSFDWSLPDIESLNAFRNEAFLVAGVQTGETLDMIKTEAEKAISEGTTFADWKKTISLKGFEAENPYYLRTNFNTAVNNAYLAADWQNIEEMKDIFPYLRYDAVNDELTRDDHAVLDGVIRTTDDPFWNEHYPPNGWNCRCGVSQLMASEVDKKDLLKPIPPVKIDQIWKKNSGKDQTIWGKWLQGKEVKSANYKELGLPHWKEIKADKTPALFETAKKTKKQLLEDLQQYLGDRTVNAPQNIPVFLPMDKINKFAGKGLKELQFRFKYMNCIDDTLQAPDEVWGVMNKNRCRFIKKYDKGIILIADMEKGRLEYFNIIVSDKIKYLNAQREGVLLYKK